ncbi:substance-K receptor-like [Montipora capricornis]|uniref:substance-K receptor-like n=1 Tax=Montipora capricornis TaxID=246305 RepID=UPI0035F209B2
MTNYSSDQKNGTIYEEKLTTFSPSACIAWFAILCTEGVAIVTINALAIIVYLKEPSLRRRSMYLVINLAVADMCVGGISLSTDLFISGRSCRLWKKYLSPAGESILISVLSVFIAASVTNLTAISLERMHASFRPLKHRVIQNWIFGAAVAAVWCIAASFSAFMSLDFIFTFLNSPGVFYLYLSSLVCCVFIILVSYSAIVVKIYFGKRPQHHGAVSRERKLTKTLFIVTVVSLTLTLPYIFFWFLIFSKRPFWAFSSQTLHLRFFLVSLAYANSVVNPILYAFRIPEFAKAMFKLLGCKSRA